ncbi:MAG: TetR/AcrR family transcriptional regulator [Balneolales bacterium]|nr:TetR/AcrR family transcriptional regulator [Balneolales bacterium]
MRSTKATIIELGDELIRTKGYNAFSYADISKPLSIKNAAVHYHFPTKPDLALSVVEFHVQSFENFVEKVSQRDALQQIKMFLNFYTSIQISGRLCVIGAFATDWNSMPDNVKEEMKLFTDRVIHWLTQTLREGKNTSLLTFEGTAKEEALSILTNIFAATQLARITGKDHFISIKDSILRRISK